MNKYGVLVRQLFVLPIRFYKKCISPMLMPACRYYPSCSSYSMEAILKHGVFYGFFLSIRRILKCNSFFEGGVDLVPEKREKKHF